MNRTLRPAALLVLLLSASCATQAPPAPPRDTFPLDPREGFAGPFPEGVEAGWQALLAGDASRARREFLEAEKRLAHPAARIGWIEALVASASLPEALAACPAALSAGEPTLPLLVACGEAHARSGQSAAAWELYRQAASRAPDRAGLGSRAGQLRNLARDELRRQAQEAALRRDWKAAREAADRSIEIDPDSAPGREAAGDIELEAGDAGRALVRYREGLDLSPHDRSLAEKTANLAVKRKDFAAAIPVLDRLAAEDPRFEEQAASARLAFRAANWPAEEQAAARAARLTRAEAARLLWWMVPQIRDAKVTSGVIASDVVGRRDRLEISRAVSMGLLDVDRDTHRASPDAPLTFGAAAKLYLHLLAFLRPGEGPACLPGVAREALSNGDAIRAARECRILEEKDGPPVSGAAFTRAVDRVRALAAKGENEPGAMGMNERPEK